jgi:hypothetical protein
MSCRRTCSLLLLERKWSERPKLGGTERTGPNAAEVVLNVLIAPIVTADRGAKNAAETSVLPNVVRSENVAAPGMKNELPTEIAAAHGIKGVIFVAMNLSAGQRGQTVAPRAADLAKAWVKIGRPRHIPSLSPNPSSAMTLRPQQKSPMSRRAKMAGWASIVRRVQTMRVASRAVGVAVAAVVVTGTKKR